MSNGKNPLISVVLRTYNQPKRILSDCIESVFSQTYSNWELIIADDSNSQESIDLINEYVNKDKRVILNKKSERRGYVGSMNDALKVSKGEFIAILDSDDAAVPERFQLQLDYFERHPQCDILGGAMNIIDKDSNVTSTRYYPEGGFELLAWMALRDPVGHPTVMFKRKILDAGFLYDMDFNKGCEDTAFWFRLRNNGYKIRNIQTPLVSYRIMVDMATKRGRDNNLNYLARKKNFSWKYFIFDIVSLAAIKTRMALPKSVISWLYRKENKQKY